MNALSFRDFDGLVTLEEAAEAAHVRVRTVETWVTRGKLMVRGMDENRARLYWLREVIEVEATTRRNRRGRPRSLTSGSI